MPYMIPLPDTAMAMKLIIPIITPAAPPHTTHSYSLLLLMTTKHATRSTMDMNTPLLALDLMSASCSSLITFSVDRYTLPSLYSCSLSPSRASSTILYSTHASNSDNSSVCPLFMTELIVPLLLGL